MKLKQAFWAALIGVFLYAWTMILVPTFWSQILKVTGELYVRCNNIECRFDVEGERALSLSAVFPQDTYTWEYGIGLRPPEEPINFPMGPKFAPSEPKPLGWENTPIITGRWMRWAINIWWGNPSFWYRIHG